MKTHIAHTISELQERLANLHIRARVLEETIKMLKALESWGETPPPPTPPCPMTERDESGIPPEKVDPALARKASVDTKIPFILAKDVPPPPAPAPEKINPRPEFKIKVTPMPDASVKSVGLPPAQAEEKASESNEKVTALSPDAIRIGLTLTEPFSSTDLRARLDPPKDRCYSWIAAWKNKGWIDTVGYAIYKRTHKFGR